MSVRADARRDPPLVHGDARGAPGADVLLRFQAAHEKREGPGHVEARYGLSLDERLELDDAAREGEVRERVPFAALLREELALERVVRLQQRFEVRGRYDGADLILQPPVLAQESVAEAELPDVARLRSLAPRGDRVKAQALRDDGAALLGLFPRPCRRHEQVAQGVEGVAGGVRVAQRGEKPAARRRGEARARAQGQGYRQEGGLALEIGAISIEARHRHGDALRLGSRIEEGADLREGLSYLGESGLGAAQPRFNRPFGKGYDPYRADGSVRAVGPEAPPEGGPVLLEILDELGEEYDRLPSQGTERARLVGGLEAPDPGEEGRIALSDGEPVGDGRVGVRP